MPSGDATRQQDQLSLRRDGAQLFRGAVDPSAVVAICDALSDQPANQAGARLFGVAGLYPFLTAIGPVGAIAAIGMSAPSHPVRAILFNKNASTNWRLAWHQDRVIAVRERIEVSGFGPWTCKHGVLHVAPPFEVLARMLTLRVHLDPVPLTNAPLLIAPGSHRMECIAEASVPRVVRQCGVVTCHAEPGDIWVYATPILHASDLARQPTRRRVLQVDYAMDKLPGGLMWYGV